MNRATHNHRAIATGHRNAGLARPEVQRFPQATQRPPVIETGPADARLLKPAVEPAQNETIRLAQQGNAEAFEAIYRQHCRRVYALCLRMLGDPVEAEDLAQEAFLQLFRKIHTFRGESAFSSWLHRLTANVVLMRFRKKTLPSTSLDEMTRVDDEGSRPRMELGGPDLRLRGVFDRLKLQKAIEQLPEGYRRMLILHDVHGYEHHEIAELFGCSTGNSKSQLHKARRRLRHLLSKVEHRRPQRSTMAGGAFALARCCVASR